MKLDSDRANQKETFHASELDIFSKANLEDECAGMSDFAEGSHRFRPIDGMRTTPDCRAIYAIYVPPMVSVVADSHVRLS